jgi:hypothetical protein
MMPVSCLCFAYLRSPGRGLRSAASIRSSAWAGKVLGGASHEPRGDVLGICRASVQAFAEQDERFSSRSNVVDWWEHPGGEPLILRAVNEGGKGTSLSSDSGLGDPTLTVTASGTPDPLGGAGWRRTQFVGTSGATRTASFLTVPWRRTAQALWRFPGVRRGSFVPRTGPESDWENPVQPDTLMLATVQGNVPMSVLNVTLRPDVDTATIPLTRAAKCGRAFRVVHHRSCPSP